MKTFISYSTKDAGIARAVHAQLAQVGAESFLAECSLSPGVNWTGKIFEALEDADIVLFIASKEACASPSVQQELGASLAHKKIIVPILTDIDPEDLPGWTKSHQAVDLRKGPEALMTTFAAIGEKVRQNKFWTGVLIGALAVSLIAMLGKK